MSSDMTDEEYEFTHEHYTHDIRKKDLLSCNEKELRIRCSFDEKYIKTLENKIKTLSSKLDSLKKSVEAERYISEEFE